MGHYLSPPLLAVLQAIDDLDRVHHRAVSIEEIAERAQGDVDDVEMYVVALMGALLVESSPSPRVEPTRVRDALLRLTVAGRARLLYRA